MNILHVLPVRHSQSQLGFSPVTIDTSPGRHVIDEQSASSVVHAVGFSSAGKKLIVEEPYLEKLSKLLTLQRLKNNTERVVMENKVVNIE